MTYGKKCPNCGYVNQSEKLDCYLCENGDLRDVSPAEHSGRVPQWARDEQASTGAQDIVGDPDIVGIPASPKPSLRRNEANTNEDQVGCLTTIKYVFLGISVFGLLLKLAMSFIPQSLPVCRSDEVSASVDQIIRNLNPEVEFAVGEIEPVQRTESGERTCRATVISGGQEFSMRVIVSWVEQDAGKYQVRLVLEGGS